MYIYLYERFYIHGAWEVEHLLMIYDWLSGWYVSTLTGWNLFLNSSIEDIKYVWQFKCFISLAAWLGPEAGSLPF